MMKKILTVVLTLAMVFSLVACSGGSTEPTDKPVEEQQQSTLEEVKGITIPEFSIKVCGAKLTNEDMAAYPLYKVTADTVNSSGTAHSDEYVGFKFTDVLEAAQVTGDFGKFTAICSDGYEVEFEGDIKADGVLLAITKNGTQFKDGPWFAPTTSKTTGDFAQDAVKFEIEGASSPLAGGDDKSGEKADGGELTELAEPVAEDKTDKITFNPYSFKVNGKEVTNADLDGLKIYRITVTTQNSKGAINENKYSGYILREVLAKLGVEGSTIKAVANDGYEAEVTAEDLASDLTIVAIEKDKAVSEDGSVWYCPCLQTSAGKYGKGIVEFVVE